MSGRAPTTPALRFGGPSPLPAGANAFGVQYQRVDLDAASGWSNVPASFSPAKQESIDLGASATNLANDLVDLYIFDSTDDATTNYDAVIAVLNSANKNGSQALATLSQGEWADVKIGLTGGRTAGMHFKAIEIAPDGCQVERRRPHQQRGAIEDASTLRSAEQRSELREADTGERGLRQ